MLSVGWPERVIGEPIFPVGTKENAKRGLMRDSRQLF